MYLNNHISGMRMVNVYSLLANDNQEMSLELLSLGVIQHLLYAMGNRKHIDAQVQASLALQVPVTDIVQSMHTLVYQRLASCFMFENFLLIFSCLYPALCLLISIS